MHVTLHFFLCTIGSYPIEARHIFQYPCTKRGLNFFILFNVCCCFLFFVLLLLFENDLIWTGHMFSLQENVSEKNFNDAIVGLQTHDEYKNKFNKYIKNRENTDGESKKKSKKSKDKKNKKNKKKRKQINNLSFDFDSDNEREITPKSTKKKKKKKKKKIQDSEKDKDKKDETTDNIATNTTETNDSNTKINEQQNSNEKNNNGGGVDDSGDSGDKSKSFDSVDSVELSGFEEPAKKRRKLNKRKTNKNKSRKIGKNPNVDTSFLPDADRDAEDLKLRESLEKEWSKEQNLIKKERLEITYSYWDGSGHRRTIEIAKGIKIGDFLELVRKELSSQFSELRGLSGDHLMYIKDDLIIPQNFTFYDLIVSGARGLSNNYMFKNQTFDKGDYTIDKDGGHPGKVITRAWYDRNKHIFPASKWEVYDPTNAQNGTSK